MKSDAGKRIWLFFGGIILGALILVARLYMLQVVEGDMYTDLAGRQYVQTFSAFNRGSIFFDDRKSNFISAATLKDGFVLAINPSHITEPELTYKRLASLVDIPREEFMKRAMKANDPYEEIAHRLSEAQAKKITELKLSGVSVYKERWRYYPADDLAAHTIGFVGFSEDLLVGRYGLELYYNDVLERENDASKNNFFAKLFSDISEKIFTDSKSEGDVYTTLEPSVQVFLESALSDVKEKWSSETVGGIIIDPITGAIFSMAASPTFIPNAFEKVKNPAFFTNPLVESIYEMGSIVKPLTMSAGLDTGKITATTTYTDNGFLILNTKRISNFDGKARGVVTMQEVLNQSLNTGAAFVARTIGNETFTSYMKNFGLGEETGIDLPNETHGLIQNLDSTRDIEHATAAYGQGIAMTPIGTVRALAALANGGTLITPHVAKKIRYKIGVSKILSFEEGRRVIRKETSEEITRMLVEVVDTALLSGKVKMSRYTIAAKTGTAQIANPQGGGYYDDRYLHSFFGYFPAYKPKFLVFLYATNPRGARYASETLTTPFIDIIKFLIQYYEIPPDR